MEKVKYNLTFWQRIELFFIRQVWLAMDESERKTWHEVKKGLEKHEHKFTKVHYEHGVKVMRCEHEGCSLCEPIDD